MIEVKLFITEESYPALLAQLCDMSNCANGIMQNDEAKLRKAVNLSMNKLHVQKKTPPHWCNEWSITSIIIIVFDHMLCQKIRH